MDEKTLTGNPQGFLHLSMDRSVRSMLLLRKPESSCREEKLYSQKQSQHAKHADLW
jgi:hypothetical protein